MSYESCRDRKEDIDIVGYCISFVVARQIFLGHCQVFKTASLSGSKGSNDVVCRTQVIDVIAGAGYLFLLVYDVVVGR